MRLLSIDYRADGAQLAAARRLALRALIAGIAVGLLAQVSVTPFGTTFRFSLGPVGFAFATLFFAVPPQLTGVAAGLMVPVVYGALAPLHTPGTGLAEAVAVGSRYLLRVHDRSRPPLHLALCIALADFAANLVELSIHPEPVHLQGILATAIVAAGRAAISLGVYYVMNEGIKERQIYLQQLLFACNLQTEAFFLQKSSREMEEIMAKAHRLYRDLAGHGLQPQALEIAKDIHEVKKDYQRTISALHRLVDGPKLDPEMNFSAILALVLDANKTYAATLRKEISFASTLTADFRTPRYGRWVTILNNLVSNGIEACPSHGSITVTAGRLDGLFILQAADSGCGIPPEDWELVFSPGFSTKLNPLTGAYSNGIGLSHVAGLVRAMNGRIAIERSDASGTVFRIEVPWTSLEVVGEE